MPDEAARAAHVIRTYVEPMKYYKETRIYLVTPMGWKHWDMQGESIVDDSVTLINRGKVEHIYGIQNMPRTVRAPILRSQPIDAVGVTRRSSVGDGYFHNNAYDRGSAGSATATCASSMGARRLALQRRTSARGMGRR